MLSNAFWCKHLLTQLDQPTDDDMQVTPTFDCTGHKYLNEAYIYFLLQGSVIDGSFIPIDVPSPQMASGMSPNIDDNVVQFSNGRLQPWPIHIFEMYVHNLTQKYLYSMEGLNVLAFFTFL